MARFAFVTWDGGGNVAVMLGVASALAARGHRTTLIGPRSLRDLAAAGGVRFAELGVPPPDDPSLRAQYLADVAGADDQFDELRRLVDDLRADTLVIDCNLAWAMQAPAASRTAVIVHTALGLYLPVWQPVLEAANVQRTLDGRPTLPSAVDAWSRADRLLVASYARFDRAPSSLPAAIYCGAIVDPLTNAEPTLADARRDDRPLIVVSYSTDKLQNNPTRLQAALDGLAGLPVAVLATTSGLYQHTDLRVPANATVLDHLPHALVMRNAELVVCHAGHGTTMAALSRGVPLVCVPGAGRDQAPIAARVAELGLGVALPDPASAAEVEQAAHKVLGEVRYRRRARSFAAHVVDQTGAEQVATELETLVRTETAS